MKLAIVILAAVLLCGCEPIQEGDTVTVQNQFGATTGRLWGSTSEPVVLKCSDGSAHYFYGTFKMSKGEPLPGKAEQP